MPVTEKDLELVASADIDRFAGILGKQPNSALVASIIFNCIESSMNQNLRKKEHYSWIIACIKSQLHVADAVIRWGDIVDVANNDVAMFDLAVKNDAFTYGGGTSIGKICREEMVRLLKQYFAPRHVSEYTDPYNSMKKALVLAAEYYVICSIDAAQFVAAVRTAHSNLSLFGDLCKRYQKETSAK